MNPSGTRFGQVLNDLDLFVLTTLTRLSTADLLPLRATRGWERIKFLPRGVLNTRDTYLI